MAKGLDVAGEALRTRPLCAGPYTFVTDALVLTVREQGRVVNVDASIAVVPTLGSWRRLVHEWWVFGERHCG